MQMSRRPCSSCASTAASLSWSAKVWPKINRPQPTRAPHRRTSRRPCPGRGIVQPQGDRFGVPAAGHQLGHAAGPVMPWRCNHSSSTAICHKFVAAQRVSRPLGSASSRSTASGRNRPRSLACGGVERVPNEVQVRALEVGERRDGEVALGPVDHLGRNDPPGSLFQHALAAVRGLQLGWAAGRQLDQFVVEEWHPALQPPRHRHVVDPLDRVVDQHHGGVQPQRPVHPGLGAGAGEVRGDEIPARVSPSPTVPSAASARSAVSSRSKNAAR